MSSISHICISFFIFIVFHLLQTEQPLLPECKHVSQRNINLECKKKSTKLYYPQGPLNWERLITTQKVTYLAVMWHHIFQFLT